MKQEFVTLPREAVERAIAALKSDKGMAIAFYLEISALRAALEQPQNHVPDAGNMAPAGWKLVPIEPTDDMLYDIQEFSHILPPRGKRIWAHMLAAAPQPPTTEDSSVVQPQANQPAMAPIAQRKLDSLLASGYTISGYSVYHEQKHQHGFVTGAGLVGWWKPDGMEYPQPQGEQEPVAFAIFTEAGNARMWSTLQPHVQKLADAEGLTVAPLYTHQQTRRKPLTHEQIAAATGAKPGTPMWLVAVACTRAIEAAHNIK